MWKWNEICNTKKIILNLLTLVKEKPRHKCIIKKSIFKNESQALRNESYETFNNELQQTNESQETNDLEIDIDNTQNEIDEMGKDIVNKLNGIRKLKKD